MLIVGIDIAKRSHEACLINESGTILGKTFSFPNAFTVKNVDTAESTPPDIPITAFLIPILFVSFFKKPVKIFSIEFISKFSSSFLLAYSKLIFLKLLLLFL